MRRPIWASLVKSTLGAAVALGALTAGQAQALTFTLANSFSFGGSSYRAYIANERITWNQARSYALALGGGYDLTSINNAAENNEIFNNIDNSQYWDDNFGGTPLGPWIGLFQPPGSSEPGGEWEWVDGTTIASNNYDAWAIGEPNNSFEGEGFGHFLGLNQDRAATWNDMPESGDFSIRSFVVEAKDATSAPGPLPIFGAAAAFGFSRKLRKRIKSSGSNNSVK